MINTRDISFIRCHRASKAPHEAGRASKLAPSIGYPITREVGGGKKIPVFSSSVCGKRAVWQYRRGLYLPIKSNNATSHHMPRINTTYYTVIWWSVVGFFGRFSLRGYAQVWNISVIYPSVNMLRKARRNGYFDPPKVADAPLTSDLIAPLYHLLLLAAAVVVTTYLWPTVVL